jgi:hypothetical protein
LNRRLAATVNGIIAAWSADAPRRRKMPKAMRKYLYTHELRHRGSWLNRLRVEVLGYINTDP